MNQIEIMEEINDNPFNLAVIRDYTVQVLEKLGINNWSVSMVLTDNERIRYTNNRWKNTNKSTDVLTFSQYEGVKVPVFDKDTIEIGDIIISLEKITEQSKTYNRNMEEELRRTIIHGLLHLNGMDHPQDNPECEMLKLQEDLVKNTKPLLVEIQ